MNIRETLAYCHDVKKKNDGLLWYHDILQYIKDQQYPKHAIKNDKRTTWRMVTSFVIDSGILYSEGQNQVLLLCMDVSEAKTILEETDEGIYGIHANRH